MRKIAVFLLAMFSFVIVHDTVLSTIHIASDEKQTLHHICKESAPSASKHATLHEIHSMFHFVALLDTPVSLASEADTKENHFNFGAPHASPFVDQTTKPPILL